MTFAALWALITSKAGGYIAAGGALLGGFFFVRNSGKTAQAADDAAKIQASQSETVKVVAAQQVAAAKADTQAAIAQVTAIEERAHVDQTVTAMPDSAALDELRANWSRPADSAGARDPHS